MVFTRLIRTTLWERMPYRSDKYSTGVQNLVQYSTVHYSTVQLTWDYYRQESCPSNWVNARETWRLPVNSLSLKMRLQLKLRYEREGSFRWNILIKCFILYLLLRIVKTDTMSALVNLKNAKLWNQRIAGKSSISDGGFRGSGSLNI